MGASSLLAASLLLLISIHQFFNGFRHNKSLLPSKTILGLQIMLPVIIISVWITTSIMLSTHFNESLLCRSDLNRDRNSCTFVDTMIVIAFITIAFWFILLLMSLIYLFQHPLPNTADGPLNLIQYEDSNEISHESLVIKALHRPTVPRLSSITTETKITTDEEKTREKKKINHAIETNATMTTTTASTAITKEWCLGIDFTPVNLNLSLPTPSELLRRDKPVYVKY
ncbi:hypothetical protein RMCBS344292_14957 [Rhizopus microsporus]|nr:hypothetical protein RMCBS344292_14957 [Rhizopus microsporus]